MFDKFNFTVSQILGKDSSKIEESNFSGGSSSVFGDTSNYSKTDSDARNIFPATSQKVPIIKRTKPELMILSNKSKKTNKKNGKSKQK
jgi:hypothetical protein